MKWLCVSIAERSGAMTTMYEIGLHEKAITYDCIYTRMVHASL
jgi:hypothetical protein